MNVIIFFAVGFCALLMLFVPLHRLSRRTDLQPREGGRKAPSPTCGFNACRLNGSCLGHAGGKKSK